MSTAQLGRASHSPAHLLVSPCQLVKSRHFKLISGPLTRESLVNGPKSTSGLGCNFGPADKGFPCQRIQKRVQKRTWPPCCNGFPALSGSLENLASAAAERLAKFWLSYVQTFLWPRRRVWWCSWPCDSVLLAPGGPCPAAAAAAVAASRLSFFLECIRESRFRSIREVTAERLTYHGFVSIISFALGAGCTGPVHPGQPTNPSAVADVRGSATGY